MSVQTNGGFPIARCQDCQGRFTEDPQSHPEITTQDHPGPPRTTQEPRAMNGLTLGAPLFAGSGPWAAPAQWCGKERLESSTYWKIHRLSLCHTSWLNWLGAGFWDDSTDWVVTLVGQLQFNMVSKITMDLWPPRSHGKHRKPAPHPHDLDIQTHGAGHEFGQDIPATIEIRTWFLYMFLWLSQKWTEISSHVDSWIYHDV